MDKLIIESYQKIGTVSHWPLPGETPTYRLKGTRLPSLELRPIRFVEDRGSNGKYEAVAWFKELKVNGETEGVFEYELTVVTTENWRPVKGDE